MRKQCHPRKFNTFQLISKKTVKKTKQNKIPRIPLRLFKWMFISDFNIKNINRLFFFSLLNLSNLCYNHLNNPNNWIWIRKSRLNVIQHAAAQKDWMITWPLKCHSRNSFKAAVFALKRCASKRQAIVQYYRWYSMQICILPKANFSRIFFNSTQYRFDDIVWRTYCQWSRIHSINAFNDIKSSQMTTKRCDPFKIAWNTIHSMTSKSRIISNMKPIQKAFIVRCMFHLAKNYVLTCFTSAFHFCSGFDANSLQCVWLLWLAVILSL